VKFTKRRVVNSIVAVSMLFSSFMTAVPASAASSTDSSRVLYYSFEDRLASDLSGNGNNGIVRGATITNGVLGSGLKFDGRDRIAVRDSDSLDFVNGEFSMAFWYKKDLASSNNGYVIDKLGDYAGYKIHCLNGALYLTLGTSSTYRTMRISDAVYNDGVWHQMVVTVGKNYVRSYCGKRINKITKNISNYNLSNKATLSIGNNIYGSSNYSINGSLDEIKIFNRELSAAEAVSLFDKIIQY